METFIIDVPVPSMGATVIELNVIALRVKTGERVSKGQRLAELESDKSTFEFESPCDGVMKMIGAIDGQTLQSGHLFCQIETSDESQRHLVTKGAGVSQPPVAADKPKTAAIWTPRAIKLAHEAGLEPTSISDIEATGPGGRVSGDDVLSYLAKRQS
jgi:pyruvate/2-oxoglutarate dehydrogenase complex dihydrolipoamide acyltransferase (E2) component